MKTVMIIDDQAAVRKMLSQYLVGHCHIIEKTGAIEAEEFLAGGGKADAIIADALMPEMTAIEFLQALQNKFGKAMPPILILSSVDNDNEKEKCFKYGAQGYLVKPFIPEELRTRLDILFENNS